MAITLQKLSELEATLPAMFPNMSTAEKNAAQQLIIQKRAELLSSSGVNPSDIPSDVLARQILEQQVQTGKYIPKATNLTELQQKEESKVSGIEQALNILKQNLGETEVQGPLLGTGANLLNKVTGGAAAPQVADYEALRKSLIGPLARSISGEVGVLTDKDIARAEGLLPKITDAKKLRENKIKNLERVIAQKKGTTTASKVGKYTIEAIE